GGDAWHRIGDASPWLVAGLAGCSIVSLVVNGTSFWLVARPIRALRLRHMLWLNCAASVLNYAPIRAGMIARVAYHLRVDRFGVLQLAAWFAALGYTLLLTLGAFIATTIIHPDFDLVWVALLAGQLVFGGLLTGAIMGQSVVVRFGRGMDRMLRQPSCLWGAIGLRLLDIGAFVGRMACAAAILDLSLSVGDTLLLGASALALSLNPLGRTGFREIAVAFVASRLAAPDLSATQLDGQMATLALIESAGEALIAIPAGAAALVWYRKRWVGAR
ncbi:MAG: hypothetical protein GY715_21265, partial [Planctomycetes bacterium]|nr:hypothetical protein [Planctomycetota bacterium]